MAICCRGNEFGGEGRVVVADKTSLKNVAFMLGVISECRLGVITAFVKVPISP